MKKWKFTIKERLSFEAILPEKSDLSTMLTRRDILKKVAFTQDEVRLFNLKLVKNGDKFNYEWVDKENSQFEYKFTDTETLVLKAGVEEMVNRKIVTDDILDLCVKIKNM